MKEETARRLGPLVHNKNFEALKMYAEDRIDHHYKQMAQATDWESVCKHQGAIKELNRIETLYDEVKRFAEEAKDKKD